MKLQKYKLPQIALFAGIYFVIFWFLKPSFLASLFTPTGGDMGSHFYTSWYANKFLFPHLSLFGWDFNWFGGYAPFIFYFPLSFIWIGLLNIFFSIPIAFKLGAITGILALPPAVYYLLRSFDLEDPMPGIGAALSLLFLFNNNTNNSAQIWGGTIMSVLAGEFGQSLSIALGLFFLGSFTRALDRKIKFVWPAIFLAGTLLAHPSTFFWVVITSLPLIFYKTSRERIFTAAKIYASAFVLSLFWVAPMIINRPYFLNLAGPWVYKFSDLFPDDIIFWPVFLLIAILYRRKVNYRFFYFLLVGLGSAFLLSKLAFAMGTYAVRFLPYIQLLWVLGGVYLGVEFAGRKYARVVPLVLLIIVGYYIINFKNSPVNTWISWNFNGLETKQNFDTLRAANIQSSGSLNDPRLVVEYSSLNGDTGTPRNNELVPLLSGRQTLEGLYLASSITNPFIFKLQSEIAADKTCQMDVIGFPCGQMDYNLGAKHLNLFNVGDLIVRSDVAKNALRARKDFGLSASFGPYEVWKNLGNEGAYVSVPKFWPVIYTGQLDWEKESFQWYNRGDILDVPMVFNAQKSELPDSRAVGDGNNLNLPRVPVPGDCDVRTNLEFNKISFKTTCPGKPHLIRVSYASGWSVRGAKKIFLTSPSFMLVYPEDENVVLTFGKQPVYRLGWLSGAFLAGLLGSTYYPRRKKNVV